MAAGDRTRVVLLGATGSIGESALKVIAAHADRLQLVGVAARSNGEKLATIAREHRVPHAAIDDETAYRDAKSAGWFPSATVLRGGRQGLVELATLPEADVILIAVVGTAGLEPAMAAIAAKKRLALASKEILVLAGKFVTAAAAAQGTQILPVDSEHNAIFQCLEGHPKAHVRRLLLTASGGAFRDWPVERLKSATREDALRHPNWAMGPKITVDSATLANKGLELIEAKWLFGLQPAQCQAILHPQSIVHGLLEFTDGSILAQLCPPSMTFPIQHALLYPHRGAGTSPRLDLAQTLNLDFRPIDHQRYPLLRLAQSAMEAGGTAPALFNAADEVAVAAFLAGAIPFLAISEVVEHTLNHASVTDPEDLASLLEADASARRAAQIHVHTLSSWH